MTGCYTLDIESKVIEYHLVLKRKYTILRGESARGKSEILRRIMMKGTKIKCSVPVYILYDTMNVELALQSKNSIIIIDEGFDEFGSSAFIEMLQKSDNYFILITRRKLSSIPYSMYEIYQLSSENRLGKQVTRNVLSNIYYNDISNIAFEPDLIITEDSNSGFQFFDKNGFNTLSSKSKSLVEKTLRLSMNKYSNIFVFVDGAAFGSEIQDVMNLLEVPSQCRITIFAVESFEYLLLKFCNVNSDMKVLDETYNYCDKRFFDENFSNFEYSYPDTFESWERFYKAYLSALTMQDKEKVYSKSELNPYYCRFTKKILDYLKKML